jgi:hypothetical protein
MIASYLSPPAIMKKALIPHQIGFPTKIIDLLFQFGINFSENSPNFDLHHRLKT